MIALTMQRFHWNQFYILRSYIRSSLWIVPFIAIPFALAATRILSWLDPWLGWSFLGLSEAGARATLEAIISATLAFVVFTFGSLLVAIQVASSQLTARIIATALLRDNVVRYTVGLFIFTFLFALSSLNKVDTAVNQLVVFTAACLGVVCFAAFFYLIDYASRLLRPISILGRIGSVGLQVIEKVYPDPSLDPAILKCQRHAPTVPDRIIPYDGTSGVVLAVNVQVLANEAERLDGVIEVVPQVGDFVATDEPLFNLYGCGPSLDEDALRATIAFGSERTMEQDPTFALRIIIDIALRALSPAINDPTTAVLAIDQLHRVLRRVGNRNLRTDEVLDKSGQLRVICRTPNWEDFVHLVFSEIRRYGSDNLQIVRRLRSMMENLIQTLPAYRHPALRLELSLLDRELSQHFTQPEEFMLTQVPDSQGLGGHSGKVNH
jgi:uncharacterized membrane protein